MKNTKLAMALAAILVFTGTANAQRRAGSPSQGRATQAQGGGQNYRGGQQFSGGGRQFSGGGQQFSGGGRQFSGGGQQFSGGGRQFNGGGQQFSGGGRQFNGGYERGSYGYRGYGYGGFDGRFGFNRGWYGGYSFLMMPGYLDGGFVWSSGWGMDRLYGWEGYRYHRSFNYLVEEEVPVYDDAYDQGGRYAGQEIVDYRTEWVSYPTIWRGGGYGYYGRRGWIGLRF